MSNVEPQAASTAQTRTLHSVFVYEAPVRIWHWINALAIIALMATGYYIGAPLLPSMSGEASDNFLFGYIRFTHFAAGYIFTVGLLGRVYWAFAGNEHAAHLFHLPLTDRKWWAGFFFQIRYYLFLEREPRRHVGSNQLDQLAVVLFFTIPSVFLIVTGFALYGEGAGVGSWPDRLFGWVIPLFGGSQSVHAWHRLAMWVLLCYVIVHVYMVFREELMSRQSCISTMVSGHRMYRD